LVTHPQENCQNAGDRGQQRERATEGIKTQKDGSEGEEGHGKDGRINAGGEQAARDKRCGEKGLCANGAIGRFGLRRLNQDSTERGSWRHDFGGFDNARTIKDRIRQRACVKDWDGGRTWELDYFGGGLGQGVGLWFRPAFEPVYFRSVLPTFATIVGPY
jgi:hypothetical protein